jgi:hypothetical protein
VHWLCLFGFHVDARKELGDFQMQLKNWMVIKFFFPQSWLEQIAIKFSDLFFAGFADQFAPWI